MSLRKKKPVATVACRPSASKKKSLSDTISELLLPQPLLDPEIDADDETRAREHAYDAADDDDQLGEIDARFSDIRKKNAKLLQDVDRKYSGKIASRKDFEESDKEDDDEEEDDDDEDAELAYENSSDEEPVGAAEDTDSEDYSEEEADEEDDIAVEGASDDEDDDDGSDDDDDDTDASDFDDNDDIDLAPKRAKLADVDADDAPDSTVTVKPVNVSAELQKGHSVQNQLHIWEKLLEMRIHSQKILIQANTLPSHEKLAVMADQSAELVAAADTVSGSVSNMLDKLTELQQLLVGQFPESKELNPRKRKYTGADDAEPLDQRSRRLRRHGDQLSDGFAAYSDYRNAVLLKWYDRTKVLTPGTKEGRHAAQHNILQNIEGALVNRAELVRKSQLHKGGYKIIGQPEPAEKDPANPDYEQTLAEANAQKLADEEAAHCAEIYDDSDFYHTQLRELIECKAAAAATPDEMNRQFVELQKLRKKMKKVVDTRASKGRKIRYVVHNKMVNFMARHDPTEWTEEGKTELYSSLFGARM